MFHIKLKQITQKIKELINTIFIVRDFPKLILHKFIKNNTIIPGKNIQK